MSGSAVMDTAIGIVFTFLAVSLVASGVVEWVSNKLNKRGEYLLRGLREMLDVPVDATDDDPNLPQQAGMLDRRRLRGQMAEMRAAAYQVFGGDPGTPMLPKDRPWLADML